MLTKNDEKRRVNMSGFAAFISCTLAAMAGVCFVSGLAVLKGKGE